MAVVHLDAFLSEHLAHMILPLSVTSLSDACAVQASRQKTVSTPQKILVSRIRNPPYTHKGEFAERHRPAAELSLQTSRETSGHFGWAGALDLARSKAISASRRAAVAIRASLCVAWPAL